MRNSFLCNKKKLLLLIVAPLSQNAMAEGTDNRVKQKESAEVIVVSHTIENTRQAGSSTELTEEKRSKEGGNDFGSIMRYQPLVSAPSSVSGSGTGKSGWDRGGYTGYNIRGLEVNRVSIDIDGVGQPIAQGRVNGVGRAGFGSYSNGRDYLDPYMYGLVTIESGATPVANSNNALGGSVSYRAKDASYYLYPGKTSHFSYQSGYDSANKSLHNGMTMAGGDDYLNGILIISSRNGQQTQNNSSLVDAYPESWRSNAILAAMNWQVTDSYLVHAGVDYYQKISHSEYLTTNFGRLPTGITSDQQDSDTNRLGLLLRTEWKPLHSSWIDQFITQFNYQRARSADDTDIDSKKFNVKTKYNTDTYKLETKYLKETKHQRITAGVHASVVNDESPFSTTATASEPEVFPQGDFSKPQADSRGYTVGAFVEDNITIGNRYHIVPGLRAIYQNTSPRNLDNMVLGNVSSEQIESVYKANTDFKVLPALALMYDISSNFTSYIQYRRGAQMPNANQLYGSYIAHSPMYVLLGNSDLKTETSDNFELGLKGSPTNGVTLSAAAFYNQYRDFIAYTRYIKDFAGRSQIVYQAENRDKAHIYGAEFSSQFDFKTWFSSLNGLNARFAIGYNKGASKSNYPGDKYTDLESVTPLKAIIGLGWDDPHGVYGASLVSTLSQGKQAQANNRNSYNNNGTDITDSTITYFKIPGYGVIDLTAYWNINQNVRLSGGVYNITNKKYWDYLGNRNLLESYDQKYLELFTASGRTFQLGLNVTF